VGLTFLIVGVIMYPITMGFWDVIIIALVAVLLLVVVLIVDVVAVYVHPNEYCYHLIGEVFLNHQC